MPHLKALYEKYRDRGFRLVSINVLPEQNKLLPDWAAKHGYTHPILKTQPGQRTAEVFQIEGTPTNFLLSQDLRWVRRYESYREGQEREMEERIRAEIGLPPLSKVDSETQGDLR